MSKKSKNRAPKNKLVAKPVHEESIGPFTVVVTVFGVYTWGHLRGQTNPKAFCRMTLHGKTFKEAIAKVATTGAFYRIESVVDEGKTLIAVSAASIPHIDDPVEELPDDDIDAAKEALAEYLTEGGQTLDEVMMAVGIAIAPVVNEALESLVPGPSAYLNPREELIVEGRN